MAAAMSDRPVAIAFVSGKGGVGKTTLAANFAWVCSHLAKTALVDLDFQNQGCTGLFGARMEFGAANALDALEETIAQKDELTQVSDHLYFLPAVSWNNPTPQELIVSRLQTPGFQCKVADLLAHLHRDHAFEIVVLDCHGGVDAVSLAAFQSCDYTLMITEADNVTFAGTLELLNYYRTESCPEDGSDGHPKGQQFGTTILSVPNVAAIANDEQPTKTVARNVSPRVEMIVNRLPSKYKFKDLVRIFERYLKKGLGQFTPKKSIFCYIPTEELIAESFGDYPFNVKLAPKSIFSKKIHFIVYELFVSSSFSFAHYKPLLKFQNARYRRRVERKVISNEAKNTKTILSFFAWFSTLSGILYLALIPYTFYTTFGSGQATTDVTEPSDLFIISVLVVCVPMLWYFMKAQIGLMLLCRSKHKYQKALFRAVSPRLTLWQRLALARLLLLRIGTTILPVLIGLYILVLLFALIIGIVTVVLGL